MIPALGHAYGDLVAEVPADCENSGSAAHYECSVCHKVFDADKVETTLDALVLPALGHAYGDLVAEVSAGCETAGTAAHYECSVCHKVFDADKVETTLDALVLPALGHAYGDLVAEVSAGCETAGTAAHYECSVCHKVFDADKVETTLDALVLPALGHAYGDLVAEVSADCENSGSAAHYECARCGTLFVYEGGEYVETTESELIIPALGEMTVLNSSEIFGDATNYGQIYVNRSAVLMTADWSAAVHFGSPNNTSQNIYQYSVFTILYVNSTPSIVLTYSDGENVYYMNTAEFGGIVKYDVTERAEGSYDQLKFSSTTSKLHVTKDFVDYYLVYDAENESIVLSSDVAGISEDKYVYIYVLPAHTYGDLIPSTATCESGGTAAHYECSVCHKVFDENKEETTLQALAVSAAEHSYGDLIEEDANGNGLMAHYECAVCHKLFDEDKTETTAQALAIGGGTGLHVTRITTDMLPTSDDPPTADLFDGFEAVDWEEIKDWTSLKSGTFYVIYGFDEGGFYYCEFENGVVKDSEATRTTASSTSLRDLFIAEYGFAFYYTTGN